jgi:hypothetical protein
MELVATLVSFSSNLSLQKADKYRLALDLHHRRPADNSHRHHIQIVDWPETATFLTDAERALLLKRLALDIGEARMDILNRRSAKKNLHRLENLVRCLHVYGRREHRLCNKLFHPDYYPGDGVYGSYEPGEEYTYVHRCCYRITPGGMVYG